MKWYSRMFLAGSIFGGFLSVLYRLPPPPNITFSLEEISNGISFSGGLFILFLILFILAD